VKNGKYQCRLAGAHPAKILGIPCFIDDLGLDFRPFWMFIGLLISIVHLRRFTRSVCFVLNKILTINDLFHYQVQHVIDLLIDSS